MDFELSQEQQAVHDTFSRFCDERVAPQAAAIDEAHEFPWILFRELGEMGFFGMRYPEADGGSGMDLNSFCLALTEIARGSMSLAVQTIATIDFDSGRRDTTKIAAGIGLCHAYPTDFFTPEGWREKTFADIVIAQHMQELGTHQ